MVRWLTYSCSTRAAIALPTSKTGRTKRAADATLLGPAQTAWLKRSLAESRAVWKFVGNPVPIAHVHRKQRPRYDKWANGDNGLPLGREIEMAGILSHIKNHRIRNVVWLAGRCALFRREFLRSPGGPRSRISPRSGNLSAVRSIASPGGYATRT